MAKRSSGDFERRKNDLYRTWDHRAVKVLLPHLPPGTRFIEPCAGDGELARQLIGFGHHCVGALDIEPGAKTVQHEIVGDDTEYGQTYIAQGDAVTFDALKHYYTADMFISNPPWTRQLLHAIIFNLYWQLPTWLLFDADWIHTLQARPYLPLLRKVVSAGRLKWIEGSKHDGKDNCAWHLFAPGEGTQFIGRP